jgi:phosphohistidine phosphatase
MLLLLVRHAQAGERDERLFPDDRLRPLTREGRRTTRGVARRLRKLHLIPTAIFSSPWKRAWQTAGILARRTGAGKEHRYATDLLARDPDLPALAGEVGAQADNAVVALVGHEPWMSELANLLLAGSPNALTIDFAKSGVMAVEAEQIAPGGGALRFFLPPETLLRHA